MNQFCRPELTEAVLESIAHRHSLQQWWVHVCLFMPDHVHLLASFAACPGLGRVVNDWKRYLARHLGVSWQRGFFEHRIRQDESFGQKADYIRMNPVRAGLVSDPNQWAYVWSWTHQEDRIRGALGEHALPSMNATHQEDRTCGALGEHALPL